MMIKPGQHEHVTTDGSRYYLDRRLTREQLDVLDRIVRSRGREPSEVYWVLFDGEKPPIVSGITGR